MKRVLVLLLLAACARETPAPPSAPPQPAAAGNAERGRQLAAQYACTACHVIPGTNGRGTLGPSLAGVASRARISEDTVANTTANLQVFINTPQALNPESAMPPIGLPDADAQDITAFLMTLR
ncbi:MAG TPA: c-type cytochrome [Thermoanaerobaculia bacterium]|nr:c-type cytochrome [Thermoanaerobaculia bacterium]